MLFPTLWIAEDFHSLEDIVSPQETDLVIIAPNYSLTVLDSNHPHFLSRSHIICFSDNFSFLPGPTDNSSTINTFISTTEECVISDLPLAKYNLLENDLLAIPNARGLPLPGLKIRYRRQDSVADETQQAIISKGTLFYDPYTGLSFATIFRRVGSDLGIASLPNKNFSIVPWVELICAEWATSDRERFPTFGDWTKNPDWMTKEEILLKFERDNLSQELSQLTTEYKSRITNLEKEISHKSLLINKHQSLRESVGRWPIIQ